MTYLFNKLKLVGTGVLALSFIMAVTLSSCGTQSDSADDTEAVEEHPTDTNAAMDSTKVEEHPAAEGDEHPSDSSEEKSDEHPTDS